MNLPLLLEHAGDYRKHSRGALDYLASLSAAQTVLAENCVGLPF